jgi:hypothetical protein
MANTAPFGSVTNIDSIMVPNVGSALFPVSYGEDAVGNLYITYIASGEVFRINTNELLSGDYNADGEVDDLDYDRWSATFGSTGSALAADGNKNGVVDAADYAVWLKNFGASVHAGAGSGGGVPEPGTSALLFIACVLLASSRLFHCR